MALWSPCRAPPSEASSVDAVCCRRLVLSWRAGKVLNPNLIKGPWTKEVCAPAPARAVAAAAASVHERVDLRTACMSVRRAVTRRRT